ncbi:UNVERIFIED_CONTAM: hypothetical protein RMT77_001975 [Armadillidium vulgare]
MNTYPRDLAIFLRERNVVCIDRLSQKTKNYLMARDTNRSTANTIYCIKENEDNTKNANTDLIKDKWAIICYKSGKKGHRVTECRARSKNKSITLKKGQQISNGALTKPEPNLITGEKNPEERRDL